MWTKLRQDTGNKNLPVNLLNTHTQEMSAIVLLVKQRAVLQVVKKTLFCELLLTHSLKKSRRLDAQAAIIAACKSCY